MSQRNSDYWENRIANDTWKVYNDIEEKNIALLEMYNKTSQNIKKELYSLAEKAEGNGGLGRTDQYRFNKLLGQQGHIFKEIEKLGEEVEKHATSQMINGGKHVYGNVMESLGQVDYSMPNKKIMEQMLRSPWKGSFFSERLWKDTGKLEQKLNSIINDGVSSGRTITEMAIQLSNAMNSSFNDAHRLIRSETINYLNRSAKRGYKDAGITKIRYWAALDERTCDECGALHDKVFSINKDPSTPHPGCRCTRLPVLDDELELQLNLREEKDGLNIMKFKNKPSRFPQEFVYSSEKARNLSKVMDEMITASKKTGYEYMSILDYATGKPLFGMHTDKKTNSVAPSWKMILKMKSSKPNSITLIHNHPNGTTFSIADVVSLNNNKVIKELIIKGNDGSEYYFSIPKNVTMDLSTKERRDIFQKYIKDVRRKYLNQGINMQETNHLAWMQISKERGWCYGKK